MFVVVDAKAAQRAGDKVWFTSRAAIVLALYATSNGSHVLAGEVESAHEGEVRSLIARHPHYRPAKPGELVSASPTGASSSPPAPEVYATPTSDALRALAIRLGWTVDDIGGTALGDQPGEAGGRSPVTGLTLAEMTLAAPASDWAEARGTHYPWELPSWKAPGPGWTPPSVASKRAPVADDVVDPDTDTDTDTDVADTGIDTDVADTDTDLDDDTESEPNPDGGDPAVALGYPADKVDAAREAALDLLKSRGAGYSYQALNYVLGKLDLPTVNAKMLEALLGNR